MLITFIVFILILSVLVLIHELGHFLVAKKFGIKVEEFGFGLPPRAFGIKKGETLYSINWLPFGGFVKLYGEDEAGGGNVRIKNQELGIKDKGRAFFAKTAWERAAVIVAGVVMNAVLAAVIFYTYLGISGFKAEVPRFGDYTFFGANQSVKTEVIVTATSKNSPAEKVGIKPLSQIVSINNEPINSTKELSDLIAKNRGKEITILLRDVETRKEQIVKAVPREKAPKDQGSLGIAYFGLETMIVSYNTQQQKLLSGIVHPVNLLAYNFQVLGKLFDVSVKEKTAAPVANAVAGPVGIFLIVDKMVQIPDMKEAFLQILNLAGILSISLAFFNVLPIPSLDGGRLFFILIEAISGKKVPVWFENRAHAIGMAIMLSLLLLITFKELSQIILRKLPL